MKALIWVLLCAGTVMAQQSNFVPYRSAPVGLARLKKGNMYLKITYGQTEKTGKWVFGYQVPYRRLWRTGSDEATELTLTDTAIVLGNTLLPGTYSVFTIPDTTVWTVIFNRQLGMSGLLTYRAEDDVFRVKINRHSVPKEFRRLVFYFEPTPEGADLLLLWDFTAVRIPLIFKP